VFIPTQLERDWLNELIPGVVDGEGIMDTLHPGIAQVDTTVLQAFDVSIDLYGVGYLHSLVYLRLSNIGLPDGLFTRCDRLPASLRSLRVSSQYPRTITLPSLPSTMDRVEIIQSTYWDLSNNLVHIEGMPVTLDRLRLSEVVAITWNGNPSIDNFEWEHPETWVTNMDDTTTLPPCMVDHMDLRFLTAIGHMNLSATSANSINLNAEVFLTGHIDWPSNVDSLQIEGDFPGMTEWPSGLRSLWMNNTMFSCIPTFPDELEWLEIDQGVVLECLPNWPANLLPENFYTDQWEPGVVLLCSVLNSTCPGIYPGITGSLFVDLDNDGVQDSDEFSPLGASVQLQPGNAVIPTETDGFWEVGLAPGAYNIIPSGNYPYIQSYTPSSHNADVPNMGDTDTDNHFAVTLAPNIQDLQARLYALPARPGFDNRLYLNCLNYGTIPVSTTLTLQWDGDQQWVGSSVAPTSISGNTATWDLGTLSVAAEEQLTVDLSTLATVPLDTPIEHVLSAGPLTGDETPDDNVSAFSDVVVGSYDPNDKLLTPTAMSPTQLQDPAARIEYTVRFQNTGTYLAERVVILDTLPEGLILESIQFLASSHPNNWYLTGGVLHVIHSDIMLPDSTSDEPNSHGFIRFSIKPVPTLENGATIANIAHIIFDFNEPIITPPAVFTVDVLASVNDVQRGTINLWPNPTRDVLRLTSREGALSNEPCVVRDLTGRAVLATNTDAGGDLNVTMLAKGAYTVQVNGQNEVLRFVKE